MVSGPATTGEMDAFSTLPIIMMMHTRSRRKETNFTGIAQSVKPFDVCSGRRNLARQKVAHLHKKRSGHESQAREEEEDEGTEIELLVIAARLGR